MLETWNLFFFFLSALTFTQTILIALAAVSWARVTFCAVGIISLWAARNARVVQQ